MFQLLRQTATGLGTMKPARPMIMILPLPRHFPSFARIRSFDRNMRFTTMAFPIPKRYTRSTVGDYLLQMNRFLRGGPRRKTGEDRILSNEKLIREIMKKSQKSSPDEVSVRVIVSANIEEEIKSGQVVSLSEAINISIRNEKDIIGVSVHDQDIPVVKIDHVGSVLYKQQNKTKARSIAEKEVRFTSSIADNDFERKINLVVQYLSKGHRCVVKVRCKYHDIKEDAEVATTVFERVTKEVRDIGEPTGLPSFNERRTFGQVTYAPLGKAR